MARGPRQVVCGVPPGAGRQVALDRLQAVPPGKRCADRLQCVSGKEKPAAAWEIADKPAVLRRAYLVASLRVTPSPFLLAVPRLAMPNMCDGHPECTTAATERHRWPLRRRGHRTARATLHQRAGRTPQSRLRAGRRLPPPGRTARDRHRGALPRLARVLVRHRYRAGGRRRDDGAVVPPSAPGRAGPERQHQWLGDVAIGAPSQHRVAMTRPASDSQQQ